VEECGNFRNACDSLWRATGYRTYDTVMGDWASGKKRPSLAASNLNPTPPIILVSVWLGVHVEGWWEDEPEPEPEDWPPQAPEGTDPWQAPRPDWAEEDP